MAAETLEIDLRECAGDGPGHAGRWLPHEAGRMTVPTAPCGHPPQPGTTPGCGALPWIGAPPAMSTTPARPTPAASLPGSPVRPPAQPAPPTPIAGTSALSGEVLPRTG